MDVKKHSRRDLERQFYFILSRGEKLRDFSNESEEKVFNDLYDYVTLNDDGIVIDFETLDNLVIKIFLQNKECTINNATPKCIIENNECLIKSIIRDTNSIDFVNLTENTFKLLKEKFLSLYYVLKESSPQVLKKDFDVVINSIKRDSFSVNFIDEENFNDDQKDEMIKLILGTEFYLFEGSPKFLKRNIDIAVLSLKNSIGSYKVISQTPEILDEILERLDFPLKNSLNYNIIKEINIKSIKNSSDGVLEWYFRNFPFVYNENDEYNFIFTKLIKDMFNSKFTISTLNSIFDILAEEKWIEKKLTHPNYYQNIFGKVCSELRNNKSGITSVVDNLIFIVEMEDILGEKFKDLQIAMEEYYNIYHSDIEFKIEKLKPFQDAISKYSALYIAKSKENTKKDIKQHFLKLFYDYFSLKFDNDFVKKRVIESRQRKYFKELYILNDASITKFIQKIIEKYSDNIKDISYIKQMIERIILNNCEHDIEVPNGYYEFCNYESINKIINRLNSGYIDIDGIEAKKYKDLISYDSINNKYYYNGKAFSEEEVLNFTEYRDELYLFNKIKREIMLQIKKIEVSREVSQEILNKISKEFPFTDEFYEFDMTKAEELISFETFYDNFMCNFSYRPPLKLQNDNVLKDMYNIFVNTGLNWVFMILAKNNYHYILDDEEDNYQKIFTVIKNIKQILKLSEKMNINICDFKSLIEMNNLTEWSTPKEIAILGREILYRLYEDTLVLSEEPDMIFSMAVDLIYNMNKRDKSTVPYINGNHLNYKYRMYDNYENDVLLSGINTDACFKVYGHDNDFLHYCCLDKNGFVIKITDKTGKFIGRASGFRNGNSVFINQLRTIYEHEKKPYFYNPNDVIETLKCACKDIINTSQKNKKEKIKIDNVFITNGYLMRNVEPKVGAKTLVKIGKYPM